MRYYDLIGGLEEGQVSKVTKQLYNGKKNKALRIFRDYYNGDQWELNGWMTDTTKSGRKAWNVQKKRPNDLGVGEGDLQIFNICDATINVYSSYARGTINDNNRIAIKDNDALAQDINDKVNLDIMIPRAITRMGVDSVCVLKYTEDGTVDFVDALEVCPIYSGDDKVGTIRSYEISANDKMVKDNNIDMGKKKEATYTEIWYPLEEKMWVSKFIDEEKIEDGVAPFEFDPYIYIANKDNEFVKFDENNIEVSDVQRLIDAQDTLNKTLTEEGIIISKVAFPMIKVIKEAYEMMADGTLDPDKFEKDLSNLSLVAGKIISAPIEREAGQDMPSGVDKFVDTIFEQIHRITGIPKSVYVSEGMSGISEKTMSAMMESLKRRVDEKRTNIERGIKQYVAMYTGNPDIMDDVSIEWAEMFAMSKEEIADLLIKGYQAGIPTIEYVLEKYLNVLGDGERFEDILAGMIADDVSAKVNIERERLTRTTDREKEAMRKETNMEREKRMQAETEKTLLTKELEDITSGI